MEQSSKACAKGSKRFTLKRSRPFPSSRRSYTARAAKMSLLPEDLSEIVEGLRAFETRGPFDAWLAAVHSPSKPAMSFSEFDQCDESVVLECTEGSNTDVVFDGVLRVDGSFAGGIRSQNGKL